MRKGVLAAAGGAFLAAAVVLSAAPAQAVPISAPAALKSAGESINLTGQVYVNQTAAFSDLHGTGANPAANAAYSDAAFVASRFRTIEVRRHS